MTQTKESLLVHIYVYSRFLLDKSSSYICHINNKMHKSRGLKTISVVLLSCRAKDNLIHSYLISLFSSFLFCKITVSYSHSLRQFWADKCIIQWVICLSYGENNNFSGEIALKVTHTLTILMQKVQSLIHIKMCLRIRALQKASN